MIPILIRKIVNWFSNNFRLVIVSIFTILVMTIFILSRQLTKKNIELDRLLNNVEVYQQLVEDKDKANGVLQLTVNELNNSKDSLIKQIKTVQKELKVKDKNLQNASVINTVIRDTIQTIIEPKQIDFDKELKLNDLTTITVSRKDSILSAKLEIYNSQVILVEEKKQYKRKYKNGFIRFLHFDFKRIRVRKYQINNSNSLIKVTSTRVIEMQK